jgi:hypothetical protein
MSDFDPFQRELNFRAEGPASIAPFGQYKRPALCRWFRDYYPLYIWCHGFFHSSLLNRGQLLRCSLVLPEGMGLFSSHDRRQRAAPHGPLECVCFELFLQAQPSSTPRTAANPPRHGVPRAFLHPPQARRRVPPPHYQPRPRCATPRREPQPGAHPARALKLRFKKLRCLNINHKLRAIAVEEFFKRFPVLVQLDTYISGQFR